MLALLLCIAPLLPQAAEPASNSWPQAVAAASGVVRYNSYHHTTDSLGDWLNTPGSLVSYENYGTNAVGETGILDISGGLSTT